MEQILLAGITGQMKHVIEKSRDGFTKGKLFLTNLMAFHENSCVLSWWGMSGGHDLPGFLQGCWYGFPQPPPRETDVLQPRQVVCAVDGELADKPHPEDGGK